MEQTVFPRVVSAKAPSGRVFASAYFPVQLVCEVFGPADVCGTVARWSFADKSRKVRYAIVARTGEDFNAAKLMPMQFIGPRKLGASFFEWATERLNLTHNGEIPPAFMMPR